MCGIAGFNWEDRTLIKRMTDIIEHRGPDGDGFYVDKGVSLGHRRLSIIDLSSAGKQPMSNAEGTIWITFNGEIYNFKELRLLLEQKGYQFRSNADTEVIIHGYEEWGENIVEKLHGMFAFAIWDSVHKTFFLARDRLGKKPIYYYWDNHKFIFASEMKALLLHPIKKNVDYISLNHYLAYFPVPAPRTIFTEIKKLLPGHSLTLQGNFLNIKKYWDLQFSNTYTTEREVMDRLIPLVRSSVEKRLMSDVPLGAFLSGGIDSSLIVALMSEMMPEPVKTFSIGFHEEQYNELKYARIIAEKFNTDHHEKVVEPRLMNILPKLIWQLDEPFADHSALPVFFVSQLAKKHVTVILSGDGGDELFGGYQRYVRQDIAQKMSRFPAPLLNMMQGGSKLIPKKGERASRFFDYVKMKPEERYAGWFTIFDQKMKEELYTPETREKIPELDSSEVYTQYMSSVPSSIQSLTLASGEVSSTSSAPSGSFMNKMSYADVKVYIPNDILVKVDKMSMLNSLEARVPLLDHQLVEFSAAIDPRLKMKFWEKKYLLKKAVQPILPKEIIYRQKKGFGIPLKEWFNGELKDFAYEELLSERAMSRGYFNREYVRTILNKHQKGKRNYGAHIWTLLCFEMWNRIYLDGEKIQGVNMLGVKQ